MAGVLNDLGPMVTVPLWMVISAGALALWTLVHRIILPGFRWYFRTRSNIVIREINKKLDLKLPEFKLTRRQVLIDRLVYDSQVMDAVKLYSRENGVPNEIVLKKVRRYAREIVPSFNAYVYFCLGNWLSRSLIRILYRVRVGYIDEKAMAEIPSGSSVVFIMNHRSNMDYILLSYLSFSRSALSFAVGEWARFWPVQQLVRAMGAFFVRRGSGNPLYRRVLSRYIQMATEEGVVQAIIPEGRLSRTGKMGEPKIGLLDYMLRNYGNRREKDIVFIPVGVNYDRVLEDRSQLVKGDHPMGKKGRIGSISTGLRFIIKNLWLMLRGGWYRFGYAVANFGPPVSVKEYMASKGFEFEHLENQDRIKKVKILAETLMDELGDIIPVVPVPLVAQTFLEMPEKSLSLLEIKASVQKLMERLASSGAHVYLPRRDSDYSIEVGLRTLTLRRLVVEEESLFIFISNSFLRLL
jgi:glycerol-3-phosphate O-acyltransferase